MFGNWNWGIFLEQAPFGNTTYLGWLWAGAQVTVMLSICAWIIAFILGSIFGILRTVPNRFLSAIGTLYVALFRNIPLIVQFFIWYLLGELVILRTTTTKRNAYGTPSSKKNQQHRENGVDRRTTSDCDWRQRQR